MQPELAGLWPPVATPFGTDGAVDLERFVAHCRMLIADGASGLALLGTTSEANSLTLDERRRVIDACVAGGVEPARLLPGTGATALDDAAVLTRHAGELGCAGVLLLPPFYYKGVSDDGLFAFVARLIERVGTKVPKILLYHIPPIAVVGWSTLLVARLIEAFPGIVVGMKDSSGDADHLAEVIETFPGFRVFPGSEVLALTGMRLGAVGCISATANINARAIADSLRLWREPGSEARQEALNAVRAAIQRHVPIPAVKAVLAARYGDKTWCNVRPPLTPLAADARSALLADPAVAGLLGAVAA